MSKDGQTWSEDSAKRSIIKLESLVKGLVKDATSFVKKNKTNGLTTPALKRKANKLIRDLEDQFRRMKERWDKWSLTLFVEETFFLLEPKYEESEKTSSEALESLHELVDRVPTTDAPGTQEGESTAINQKGNLQNLSLLSSRHIPYPILLT